MGSKIPPPSKTIENKTARMTILVDPAIKKAFEELCVLQDLTPSQVLRRLMREHLAKNGVSLGPASLAAQQRKALE